MKVLLANDDGIFSPGLASMAQVLRRFGEVCIAAPAAEQSGVGPAITFLTPLLIRKAFRHGEFWGYAVEGTPVDCVKIGIAELAGWRPDLVVSGVNNGLNVGINLLYSGTVAAVQEAAWQGIPAVAVSTQFSDTSSESRTDRIAEIAGELIQNLLKHPQIPGTLFNINIPFAALEEGADLTPAVVPVDMTPYWGSYEKRFDPANRGYYWITDRPSPNLESHRRNGLFTDMAAISAGKIAISPVSVSPTASELLSDMKEWKIKPADFRFSESADSTSPDFQLKRWVENR